MIADPIVSKLCSSHQGTWQWRRMDCMYWTWPARPSGRGIVGPCDIGPVRLCCVRSL